MAKMLQKSGNFFKVTDTISSDVEINISASLINYIPISNLLNYAHKNLRRL